jgi:hypothetical protein
VSRALSLLLAVVVVLCSAATANAANLLQNPSLESVTKGVPTCWQKGGSGTNSYSFSVTTAAKSGTHAERVTISSRSSGDRKLVSAQDSGACAPSVAPGAKYSLSVWYYSDTRPYLYAYAHTSSGWSLLGQSQSYPSTGTYTKVSWPAPALPSGADRISVGMGIRSVGTVTMDDFSLDATSQTPPPPPPTTSGTVKSGEGSLPPGYPRSDAGCVGQVQPAPENRPGNTTANNTVPPNNGANVPWNTSGDNYFTLAGHERSFVTGQYTGTTDQILQWGACKWGFDANLLRAVATVESYWRQNTLGDVCGPVGEASYGLTQVMNRDCSGTLVHGGWRDTQTDTALSVDFAAQHDRACLDGAYDGWLYDGGTVSQDIANHQSYADPIPLTGDHGQDYVLWGCIGNWFSGGWWDSGAQSYIATVQNYYTSKPWLQPGF